MNRKQLKFAAFFVLILAASLDAAPVHAQFLKKLLQGGSQQYQNEYQPNQFRQQYQNGYQPFSGGGQSFFNGRQPFSGGYQQYQGGSSFDLTTNLNSLDASAEQVSNRVQKFLQSTGRWAPQPKGNDMQVCVAMQSFKQQIGQVKRNAGGRMTPQFQMQLTQLQQSANNVVSVMQMAGIDPGTRGQMQVLRDNVSQMIAMSSITSGGTPQNPFWNSGQAYPGAYGSPMLHVSQAGRGQLTVMGQPYMRFRDVALETIDPVSRRVRASFSAGRDGVILSGPITQQSLSGVTIAVDSSDKGAVSGVLNISFVANGSIGSINSTGQMNGQGYAIQFNGQ